VGSQVTNDFQVWAIRGNIATAPDMAQERHVDEGPSQLDTAHRRQRAHRNGLTTALGMTENGDSGGVDQLHLSGSLEATESVSEEPTVIVAVGVGKRLGHKPGGACPVVGIRTVFRQGWVAPPLTTWIDDDMCIASSSED